jgi:hypothetical protein
MIAAGACEGIFLGLGQSIGFGSFGIPRAAWITATGGGAAVAWSIGMLPSTIGGVDFASPSAVALMVVGAAVLLASIPTLQWLVLRRVIRRASWWIPVNTGAWAAGILWTFAPSPFIDENTALPALLGSYLVAGILMAVTVGALTGFAARQVVESTHYSPAQALMPENPSNSDRPMNCAQPVVSRPAPWNSPRLPPRNLRAPVVTTIVRTG